MTADERHCEMCETVEDRRSASATMTTATHGPTIAEIVDLFRDPDDDRLRARPCAWCLDERGEVADEGDSHGICRTHARGLLRQSLASRLHEVIGDLSGPAYLDPSRRLKLAATLRRAVELLQEDAAWAV